MSEIWVANSSPVIVLAKVGHLTLLQQLADEVVLPDAVVAEILAGPRGLVPQAADVLRVIRAAGLHLDDRVIRLALGHIGETW